MKVRLSFRNWKYLSELNYVRQPPPSSVLNRRWALYHNESMSMEERVDTPQKIQYLVVHLVT